MTQTTVSGPFQQVDMPAVDLRQAFLAVVASEGVRTSTDLLVTQRGAGANMSVDVAAGSAMILDDHGGATGGGFFSYTQAAVINAVIAASDPTNPRIDRVVARARDAYQGDATNAFDIFVVTGTPTAGATLANCNGAGSVPGSCLLIANVLVGATVTSITNANIDTTGSSNNSPKVRPLISVSGIPSSFVQVYDRATSTVDVVSTASETSLYTKVITAGDLGTTRMVRLTLIGDYLHNNVAGDALTWRIKFGGTTFWANSLTLGAVTGVARHPWAISLYVCNLGVANSQMIAAYIDGETASATAPTTGIGAGSLLTSTAAQGAAGVAGISTLGAIDTTANQTLDVTAQWTASSVNNSWRLRYASLELV